MCTHVPDASVPIRFRERSDLADKRAAGKPAAFLFCAHRAGATSIQIGICPPCGQIPICRSAVLNGYAHVFYNYGIKRHPHRIDAGECFSGDFPVRLPGQSRPPGGLLPAGHGGWGRRFPECSTESPRIPGPSARRAGSWWSGWGGYTPKRPARRWQ